MVHTTTDRSHGSILANLQYINKYIFSSSLVVFNLSYSLVFLQKCSLSDRVSLF